MSTTPVLSPPLTATGPTGTAASGAGGNGLTINDFLTLLTAQLKNQDPLNPTNSSTFLQELSDMSNVQGISNMDSSMSSLSNSMLQAQAVSSASLVGHKVLAAAGSSTYTAGSTLSGAVQVPQGASNVTLDVTDANGGVVRQIAIPSSPGAQSFSWNGTDSNGNPVPSGTYGFTATASVNGSSATATTLLPGTVGSVSIDSTGTGITLNTAELGAVSLSNVDQID